MEQGKESQNCKIKRNEVISLKKIQLKFSLLLVLAVAVGSIYQNNTESQAKAKINKTSITIRVKQTYVLKVTGTNKKVKWSSSKKKVATVSSKGVVTGKRTGKTMITAKAGKKPFLVK